MESDPFRRPSRHHANPQRSLYFEAVGQILSQAQVLTTDELKVMGPDFDYSAHTAAEIVRTHVAARALAQHGVDLVFEKYKGRYLFRDGSADTEEALAAAKQKIDEALLQRPKNKKPTS